MVCYNEEDLLGNFNSVSIEGETNDPDGGSSSITSQDEPKRQEEEETMQKVSAVEGVDASPEVIGEEAKPSIQVLDDVSQMVSNEGNTNFSEHQADIKERLSLGKSVSKSSDSVIELEKVKKEMKSMETALPGAARQAQRKSNEAEVESVREEYQQKVSTLERKVYTLTKGRNTSQNKESDAAVLLKEKDENITQVMAEGKELSNKQAAQESKIRKLHAQISELEEEKKGLETKLQVEESKVESLKTNKAATEKLLQETIEKNQAELAAQKEFYTNDEARIELEGLPKESTEREAMLIQTLEELRQTLSRKEQQAVSREDRLRRDIEDLQNQCEASDRRYQELSIDAGEYTRPLVRQIEAIQETTAKKEEAWNAVERALTSRLQEAEAKAAEAEERKRAVNERLSHTLSRINVLEAEISSMRKENSSLRKYQQERGSQILMRYLETSSSLHHEMNQLRGEIRVLNQELHEALTHRNLLQQDTDTLKGQVDQLQREIMELSTGEVGQLKIKIRELNQKIIDLDELLVLVFKDCEHLVKDLDREKARTAFENGKVSTNASSVSSMDESFYLQASLDSSDTSSERKNPGEPTLSSYYRKSKTPNVREAALQVEGDQLARMKSIQDSLAEDLDKMTEECKKLQSEVSQLPGLKTELETLRQRHSAALELMGEQDEKLEELRADIVDLKEMYREQVNILVNKIQVSGSSVGAT